MIVVPRGVAVSLANPALDFAFANGASGAAYATGAHATPPGYLEDVTALSYAIFDVSTSAKQAVPVQVWPALPTTSVAVTLATAKITAGRYILPWSPSATEALGKHIARTWCTTPVTGAAVLVQDREFEVAEPATAAVAKDGYCLISDLRDEEVVANELGTDARLAAIILQCSRLIERYTGRFFEPRYLDLFVSGRNARKLFLEYPIIALESVAVSGVAVDAADIVVYNRHLSQRLTQPDDRDNPKIEYLHSYGEFWTGTYWSSWSARLGAFFPYGQGNVEVKGVFGYTDWDGSAVGKTPDLIRHACKLMCIREIPKLTDHDEREDRRQRSRITSEGSDRQSRGLQPLPGTTLTGDYEIDHILHSYMRSPSIRGV